MTRENRMPRVGDVVADKYRIERVLGTGGMGQVVLAHHLVLDHLVALKFIHDELVADETTVKRFAVEARAAARLRSENAVRILDVDKLPGGAPYIVMEYLEGMSLGAIAARGP